MKSGGEVVLINGTLRRGKEKQAHKIAKYLHRDKYPLINGDRTKKIGSGQIHPARDPVTLKKGGEE